MGINGPQEFWFRHISHFLLPDGMEGMSSGMAALDPRWIPHVKASTTSLKPGTKKIAVGGQINLVLVHCVFGPFYYYSIICPLEETMEEGRKSTQFQ